MARCFNIDASLENLEAEIKIKIDWWVQRDINIQYLLMDVAKILCVNKVTQKMEYRYRCNLKVTFLD